MSRQNKKMNLSIPDTKLYEDLENFCLKHDRPKAWVICHALRIFLKKYNDEQMRDSHLARFRNDG